MTRRRVEVDVSALARAYEDGATLRELAAGFGVSASTVRKRLAGAGVQIRWPGPAPGSRRRLARARVGRCIDRLAEDWSVVTAEQQARLAALLQRRLARARVGRCIDRLAEDWSVVTAEQRARLAALLQGGS